MSDDGNSMKWRCAWCGKPHDRNDPPCDECGHHKLEKAVVPVAPETREYDPEPVWVCPECEREHQKNSPPCKRCGNPNLEQRAPDHANLDDIGATSYLDLLTPQYAAAFLLAVLGVSVLLLGLAGVITLPGMSDGAVPGNATATENGVSLASVERAYVNRVNEQRTADGQRALARDGDLSEAAGLYNRGRVRRDYGEGSTPNNATLEDAIGDTCGERSPYLFPVTVQRDGLTSESERLPEDAAGYAQALRAAFDGRYDLDNVREQTTEWETIGVHLHRTPTDALYITQVVC